MNEQTCFQNSYLCGTYILADSERMSTLKSHELSTNHLSAVTPWVPDQTHVSLFNHFEMELIIHTSWDYCENKFHNHSKAQKAIWVYRSCWMHVRSSCPSTIYF